MQPPASYRSCTHGTRNWITMSICTASFPAAASQKHRKPGNQKVSFSSRYVSCVTNSKRNTFPSWLDTIRRGNLHFPLPVKASRILTHGRNSKTGFMGKTGALSSKRPSTDLAMPSNTLAVTHIRLPFQTAGSFLSRRPKPCFPPGAKSLAAQSAPSP